MGITQHIMISLNKHTPGLFACAVYCYQRSKGTKAADEIMETQATDCVKECSIIDQ